MITKSASGLIRLFFVAGLLFISFSLVTAQEGTSTLRGTVTDQNGAVVPNATVSIANQETGINRRSAVTNDNGNYVLSALTPGLYRIIVEVTSGFSCRCA
jgi:protocatechuate 3,4-dioxygenase beta subunit